jgi:hypothetical protein
MRSLLLALLVCLLTLPILAAPDAATLAAGYASPTLGTTVLVGNVSVTLSNTTFVMSGTAAPLMVGEKQVGVFLVGKGHYRLRSVDPIEESIVRYEAKKLDRLATKQEDGSVVIEDSFDRILLLISGAPQPELKGPKAADDLVAEFRNHKEKYSNALWASNAHLLAMRDATAAPTPVAIAEMSGTEATAWVLDTVETKRETLTAFVNTSSAHSAIRHLMIPVELSNQPVGKARADFLQPLVLLVDVDYTLVDAASGAKLSVTETLVPRRAATSAIRLNFNSGEWDDLRYREVKLKSVTDEAGKPLKFHHDRDSVIVDAGRMLPVGEPFVIRFEIEGDILLRPDGHNYWQLGIRPWFPQPDDNGQFYTVHSLVKVRKPWIGFTPGNTVARKEEGDYNVVESVIDKPMQYAVAHAGKYTMYEEKFGDLTIRVAPYGSPNERAAKQLAKFASQIIRFYEPWLGPFPFKEFNIIEMSDLGYGQAPPGTMFITSEAFRPLINEDTRLYSEGVNQRFAHEIAHQYFGHVVKMGSDDEQWISEAFSEYVSALVEKQITGKDGYDALVKQWRHDAKEATAIAPIVLARRVYIPGDWTATWKHRTALHYGKGAYLLATLHKELGDQKFFLFLRNVQGLYAGRFVTTKNLAETLKKIDGKDYTATFEKYVWGMEMPGK